VENNYFTHSRGLEKLCHVQRTESPEEAIRGACLQVINACGMREAPISLTPILNALNIKFSWSKSSQYWNVDKGTASLKLIDHELEIHIHELQARRNWRRTRFSIAHEIIHALIIRILKDPDLISTLDATDEAYAELERVCNIGAAELLMPSKLMRQALKDIGLSPSGLVLLYDKFLVSKEALIWRIASVMPLTSVIKWRSYARNNNEENRLRVLSCYPPYKMSDGRAWLPRGTTTKHLNTDIVELVSQRKKVELCEELNITLGKKIWKCEALGTMFMPRNNEVEQPKFEGFQVPDDKESSWNTDVLVFASIKPLSGKTPLLNMKNSTIDVKI
jgi:Zn-dependent peptidase ImmA (M78 family)